MICYTIPQIVCPWKAVCSLPQSEFNYWGTFLMVQNFVNTDELSIIGHAVQTFILLWSFYTCPEVGVRLGLGPQN